MTKKNTFLDNDIFHSFKVYKALFDSLKITTKKKNYIVLGKINKKQPNLHCQIVDRVPECVKKY